MSRVSLKTMASNRDLKAGHFLIEFNTPGIGYILKHATCDFAVFDTEHSGYGIETVKTIMAYMRAAGMPTVVRVPSREYRDIARVLDAGADGVMLPMVSTEAEAKDIVHSVKYTPVGRTLGSVGMGNIGEELFRVAQPFGMKFIAHDPYADPGRAAQLGVERVELDDVFRRADFVTINCPLTESTRHLVNRARLELMKPDAYLINTARGPLVDQSALTEVLRSGRIAGAGLDVLETEPPDADDPILALDNVIITPHALCWTDQLFQGNGRADVEAVIKVLSGEVPAGIVNREIIGSPVWVDRLAGYRARFS